MTRKFLSVLAAAAAMCFAAVPQHHVAIRVWTALWVDVPGAAPQDYGVYHFRRTFDLPLQPQKFVVHVSGDNRYQLSVNGTRVSWGPARSDLTHWQYETVDIAPQLHAGKNVVAAVVWNDGPSRSVAQISNQTGFLLQAEEAANAIVNSNRNWKCTADHAYSAQPILPNDRTGYYALAPNEHVDAHVYPWGWENADFDDSTWTNAHELSHAADRDARDAPNRWMLVPRQIPLEEQVDEQPLVSRQATGISLQANGNLWPLAIPANTTASILWDQGHLTTAYPELTLSDGLNAQIDLHYAESLFSSGSARTRVKGNRNEIEGKVFLGPFDSYASDGGQHRVYRPLYWRTYRYLQVTVQTRDQPVVIESLRGVFTGYPFHENASFTVADTAANADIQKILSTGFHTARLCAHETYMDCPFYEQLQYAGDARIQGMVSIYMTGDARLLRNGISLLNSSRTAEGATLSRAPSNLQQYIPPFSLWWIGMVHDYWMYVDDPDFVSDMLPGVEAVLTFYSRYQKENGSLDRMPWWNFVDWVKQWPSGEAPAEADGSSSAALDLQLLLAYRWAARLEHTLGNAARATEYEAAAAHLQGTVLKTDWDPARGLFADQPSHRTYSQQVNTLAVLAHVVTGAQARAVVEKLFADPSLAQSSIYFRAYTNAALREVGLGGKYPEMLGPWRNMLSLGLTTWAEWDGPDARSDCHAWGASPNFEFLRTVAGIDSAAPGFKRVRIAPNLGTLPEVTAQMPHPQGQIRVHLRQSGTKLVGTVDLPPGTPGFLEWHGQRQVLRAGSNRIGN